MPLAVHRSEQADALVGGLARLLVDGPADPFTRDVVAVPSKGVERWIAQSLATVLGSRGGRADGICANVVFPSPARLVREAVTAGSGIAADEDPWAEHRLAWPLLEVIDGCAGDDWCRTLGRHLGLVAGGSDTGRRMAVAQKLARLFTSYGAQRPAMLRAWLDGPGEAGLDTEGFGHPLDPDHAWQPELWRRVRAHIGSPSPAERIDAACARLRDEPGRVDLPERLSLFGATRLTTDQLQVIDALGARREVHLWLPHPSWGLWNRVAESGGPLDADGEGSEEVTLVALRRTDPTADVAQNPLVRSLGRDAREMQLRLRAHTAARSEEHLRTGPGTQTGAETLLRVLQRDLREDRAPRPEEHVLSPGDSSVRVHACHGRQRQVEVLREALLGMLADDPTLELRDVIVMCPDIESYAPLIAASFGLSAGSDGPAGETLHGTPNADEAGVDRTHAGHRLTVRLADRSLRQTNPVLGVTARLLELADSRLTVSEVLDLAAMPPVRRRFRLDDDALERIGDWVRRAGVRWGLDAEARRPYGLGHIRQNTWRAGLDRLLVGVTMDEEDLRTLDRALPLDDVDSTEIGVAGRLAELVDRLSSAVTSLSRQQPLRDWVTALAQAVEAMVEVSAQDAWQLSSARWQLTDALSSAHDHGAETVLGLSDVRALLSERLRGRPTRANFRTGHLTMCTMVPMRSVPHRVVCLLGVDDGVFPRGNRIDGDDILARCPRVGERDPRSEDRQLFLDAILAARERLVVLYTGADERSGATRPPAVPLGELLDVLDRSAVTSAGRVRDQVLVRHPLQPFDSRNFRPGGLTGTSAFSFDSASYAGSLALQTGRQPRPPFLDGPLPEPEPQDTVPLDSLVRFLEHPVKQFLRQRLGLSSPEDDDQPSDLLPVAPDPLERWAVGDRLLAAGLVGLDRDAAVRAEWLRGDVPPGQLGGALVEPIAEEVGRLVTGSAGLRAGVQRHLDVAVALPGGAVLAGTVGGVHGDRVVRIVYSRLSAKHRLRAWVHLLALMAQWPDQPWEAVTVGRGSRGGTIACSRLSGVDPSDAVPRLAALVEVYRLGMCLPLPMPPKTACAYAGKRLRAATPNAAAAFAGQQWRKGSGENEQGEFADVDHQRVWGDAGMSALLEAPADPHDTAWPDEPHRFGQLARRVWTPLLQAETVTET